MRNCSLALLDKGPAGLRPLRRGAAAVETGGREALVSDDVDDGERDGVTGGIEDEGSFNAISRSRLTLRGGLTMPRWYSACANSGGAPVVIGVGEGIVVLEKRDEGEQRIDFS